MAINRLNTFCLSSPDEQTVLYENSQVVMNGDVKCSGEPAYEPPSRSQPVFFCIG